MIHVHSRIYLRRRLHILKNNTPTGTLSYTRLIHKGNTGSMAKEEKSRLCEMAHSPPPASNSNDPPVPTIPRASILLISTANQILLLHRVITSSAFPSAHVFPGGHIDVQDGALLSPSTDPKVHEDNEAYRTGAIRECFEESGILLAKRKDSSGGAGLLDISVHEREEGRKAVHAGKVSFRHWVASKGGVPDLEGLIPFTRWLTPKSVKKRYTTQMYLYFLPLESSSQESSPAQIPTSDGGIEHTEAVFDYADTWLEKSKNGEIVLFPPQVFLLIQIAAFLKPLARVDPEASAEKRRAMLEEQRARLLIMVQDEDEDPSWAEKCISPRPLRREGAKVVMGLDYAGDEVQGENRRGDLKRVMVWSLGNSGPTDVQVQMRSQVEKAPDVEGGRNRGKL